MFTASPGAIVVLGLGLGSLIFWLDTLSDPAAERDDDTAWGRARAARPKLLEAPAAIVTPHVTAARPVAEVPVAAPAHGVASHMSPAPVAMSHVTSAAKPVVAEPAKPAAAAKPVEAPAPVAAPKPVAAQPPKPAAAPQPVSPAAAKPPVAQTAKPVADPRKQSATGTAAKPATSTPPKPQMAKTAEAAAPKAAVRPSSAAPAGGTTPPKAS
jgi:translation initiation factor IF-3